MVLPLLASARRWSVHVFSRVLDATLMHTYNECLASKLRAWESVGVILFMSGSRHVLMGSDTFHQ
jgi:hypothetical protein